MHLNHFAICTIPKGLMLQSFKWRQKLVLVSVNSSIFTEKLFIHVSVQLVCYIYFHLVILFCDSCQSQKADLISLLVFKDQKRNT